MCEQGTEYICSSPHWDSKLFNRTQSGDLLRARYMPGTCIILCSFHNQGITVISPIAWRGKLRPREATYFDQAGEWQSLDSFLGVSDSSARLTLLRRTSHSPTVLSK